MVVLDASSSMKQADAPGPRIDAAKQAIGDLVGALPDGVPVGLMAFGTATGPTKADKAAGCKDVRTLVGTGETRYYRVRLGWGQRLSYRVGIPSQPGLDLQSGSLDAAIASPLRERAEQSGGSDSGILVGGPNDQDLSGSTVVPVRYANRDSRRVQAKAYALDGDYYLVLDFSYPTGDETPFAVPLTITVATEGPVESGPTYIGDPATHGGPPSTAAAAGAGSGGQAGPGSGSTGLVLALGAAVLAVVAGLALWWRRRAGRTG